MTTSPANPPKAHENPSAVAGTQYPFQPVALGLLSAVVPGTGHLILGQRRKGTIFLVLFVVLLSGFWPFRALRYYAGFLGLFGSWVVLGAVASCSGFLSSRALNSARPSKWGLVLIAPISFAILSLTGAALTRLTGFYSFVIPSTGMELTIHQGDHIVADMQFYRSRSPNPSDTILFKKDGVFYIKRVIARGGDVIEGKGRVIFVNGKKLDEPYVEHIGEAPEWANTFGPISVPRGTFFVMGDNRDYSLDSRAKDYGVVNGESVVGKPLYIFRSDRTGQTIH